jgi:lipoprotein-anchoring transpeptidase ErfK/SrfK
MRSIASLAFAAALAGLASPAHANVDQAGAFPFFLPFFPLTATATATATAAPAATQEIERRSAAARSQAGRHTREVVSFSGNHAPGTIVVSTKERRLYLVMQEGKAMRYAVGVGREGFQWAGTQTITNKQEWPDWRPPEEMIRRRPDLPRYMAGGPHNPLGARAMYLGGTLYRIHGSNEPETIGRAVSSGCIRMLNEDVVDLYQRVKVGTQVVVLR